VSDVVLEGDDNGFANIGQLAPMFGDDRPVNSAMYDLSGLSNSSRS
jgi:hypothetical protein